MSCRVVCVWLPMWSIDLVRRQERRGSTPQSARPSSAEGEGAVRNPKSEIQNPKSTSPAILLIATKGNQQHIAYCCEQAAAAGVVRGMSLAHACALLPIDGVSVEEHNPARDALRLKSLASWARRFTPVVAPNPPDGLLLDVTGCQRLHRGERRLINAIANSLDWLGFYARIACASNFACARAVARYGSFAGVSDRIVVGEGDELDLLRDLPIEGLRLEQETIDALHEVNIAHIGELTCLPRNDLAARFGPHLLLRLDQALGDADETIEPQRPSETLRAERAFDGPVRQIEGVAITVQELIASLCTLLQQAESGARRLDVDFERIDTADLRETITLSRPNRDAKHLWSLLRPKVEQINLGFGVEKIVLSATHTGRLPHAQVERWRDDAAGDAAIEQATGELIDTLANRLGAKRITRATLVESHLPERAFRHEPAMSVRDVGDQASAGGDRPTTLFDEPELIEVLSVTPEGPPRWMKWRGEEHTIIASNGPERIGEEWWRSGLARGVLPASAGVECAAARDYFRIQLDDGRWLWVYRQLESGRWFVHGEWT
ncbi:MAG TPA: DNA polymerase Y family protein [Phycisphaerales bacterium]|nr:DNA polymerase Y family protein [Phycisphaerales bacterium]